MRVSLLTSLCAFIEMVITTRCRAFDSDPSYNDFVKSYPSFGKPSTVYIAREFLLSKGISGLNEIPNWEYIFNMMKIRNCFVHVDGRSSKHILGISGLYDFTIIEGKIVLGNNFKIKYIEILEVFSVSFAKLLYTDEGFEKKIGIDTHNLAEALEQILHFKREEKKGG